MSAEEVTTLLLYLQRCNLYHFITNRSFFHLLFLSQQMDEVDNAVNVNTEPASGVREVQFEHYF